ncbi:peptidoglycan-binding protein [Isoptericola hypogeus]|uniref:Peptidoglycan-binding protein n=1 Tax=Isoptericola hypogeus TaxID=300179 RepID=A0ABP4VHF1_9MICO
MTADERDPAATAPAHVPRRRRRRGRAWLVAGACVAAVGITATLFAVNRPQATASDTAGVTAESQLIARGDLTDRVRLSGRLGYSGAHDLGTSLSGTLTEMPRVGSVVKPGGVLFRVDDQPVVMFRGKLPVWRVVAAGMDDGPDVQQLEKNLAALGFFDGTVDESFTSWTAEAIKDWQESLGLERTGTIEPGRIVFAPGPQRVTAHQARVGDPAGPGVVSVSGTTKRVSASVDPNLKDVAVPGAKVRVTLPGSEVADATVTSVGAPVEQDDGDGGKKLMLPLTITLDDESAADGLDDVTVSGEISVVKREDVLLAPVLALLATSDGGYAVEVVVGDTTRRVPVELGIFAGDLVEVTGGDLEAGDEVVVGR